VNYLAHLYLSENNSGVQIGNFIADALKGNRYMELPVVWQIGVLLHREIDSFTDAHPVFKKHVRLLFPVHRHYSRVIVDLVYDHFLAVHWDQYSSTPLAVYSADFYRLLDAHKMQLPQRIQQLIPVIRKHNWLVQYADLEGLRSILSQMSRRAKFECQMDRSVDWLIENYTEVEHDFFSFFEVLKKFSQEKLHILNQNFRPL